MDTQKKWYEIIFDNWSQITVLLGIVGFVIKTLTVFFLKKKEITFSRLQENKILEIKSFYKSYQKLNIDLSTYLNQMLHEKDHKALKKNEEEYIKLINDIYDTFREDIHNHFFDFRYNAMTIKLFFDNEDLSIIDEISNTFDSILKELDTYRSNNKLSNTSEGWENLERIRDEDILKRLPELIKKIEVSLRQSFKLK